MQQYSNEGKKTIDDSDAMQICKYFMESYGNCLNFKDYLHCSFIVLNHLKIKRKINT